MGLTVYEAKAYLALLQKHPSHGHEISRRSGVPGPKIYETLSGMLQKGLAAALNTDPRMYSPLPHREFLTRKSNEFRGLERRLPGSSIWTFYDVVIYGALFIVVTIFMPNGILDFFRKKHL